MTSEQEQIVLDMLCKLRVTKLVWVQHSGTWMLQCLLCDAAPSALEEFFKHTPDCPIELAQRLQATRNTDLE